MSRRLHADAVRSASAVARCGPDQNMVYVLRQRGGHGYVKIGTTVDLVKRVGDHQGNAYGELEILGAFHGNEEFEKSLHQRFAKERVWDHREHFRQSKRILRWVDDVQRLSFRDNGECWSCREAGIRGTDMRPWGRAPFVPALKNTAERIDLRCGSSCDSRYAWFDRTTRRLAHGRTTSGLYSTTPIITATALFHAHDAALWAMAVWIANRRVNGFYGAGVLPEMIRKNAIGLAADEHAAILSCSIDLPNRHSILFPEHVHVHDGPPLDPDSDEPGIRGHYRRMVTALRHIDRDILGVYGVAAICGCPKNDEMLSEIDRDLSPHRHYLKEPVTVPRQETPMTPSSPKPENQ